MTDENALDEYEAAKARLAAIQQAWENYSGNNPDKHRSELREAREAFAVVEADLKRRGILPLTELERLHAELDRTFPNAKSREVVTFEGVQYRRRFYPATRSNSGKTVRSWDKTWERV